MKINHLDLCDIRCPMALLQVKRASRDLTNTEQLVIDVTDTGAKKDILRYLETHGFNVLIQDFSQKTRFVITQ